MIQPLILISNYDGIQAAGLNSLCEAMLPLGEMVVMAPDMERSAMGHAITLSDPLRVTEVDLGLPKGTLLNVNIPNQHTASFPAESLKGRSYNLTVHGQSDWQDQFDCRTDPHHRMYYWLTDRKREIEESFNTDEKTLKAGKVSITPLHYDLSDYQFIADLVRWDRFQPV